MIAVLLFGLTACGDPDLETVVAESPTATLELMPTPTPAETISPAPPTSATFSIPATPTPTLSAPSATPIATWFEGVFVDLPEGLGSIDRVEHVEHNRDELEGQADADLYLLSDWPIEGGQAQPAIWAYSRFDLASSNILKQLDIEKLERLLQDGVAPQNGPTFNLIGGEQAFVSRGKRQPFKNGDGYRYVTWRPVSAEVGAPVSLLYVWQGLTADGRGVLTAEFPIQMDGLSSVTDSADGETLFAARVAEVQAVVAKAEPNQFNPPLAQIDALVASIDARIARPELVFDINGKVDLTISYPKPKGEALIGRPLQIEGYLQPGPEQPVEVFIISNNNTLAGQTVLSTLDGWWQATLDIPANYQGIAELIVVSGEQTDQVQLELRADPTLQTQEIEIVRPETGHELFAGYPVYVDGQIGELDLVDDLLTVSVRMNNCQTQVARQTLNLLPTDEFWHAELFLPEQISGSACLVTSTGSYGQPLWREVQVPITITDLDADLDGSRDPQIVIGNSILKPVRPNTTITLFGSVIGTLQGQIPSALSISLSTSSASSDENIVLLDTVRVEPDPTTGRWETVVLLPNRLLESLVVRVFLENNASIEASAVLPVPISD